MKKLLLFVFTCLIFTNCTLLWGDVFLDKYKYYQVAKGRLSTIQFTKLKDCPCTVFNTKDKVSSNSLFGVKVVFIKEYYYFRRDSVKVFGNCYSPGKLGVREKIKLAKILLKDTLSNKSLDVTQYFYCDQTFLDNTNHRWSNYPDDNKDMSCYYKDEQGNYRVYNTTGYADHKPAYSKTSNGVYFSKLTSDSTYVSGWDLKATADAFNSKNVFKSVEDFKVKFNNNRISYRGNDLITLVFASSKKLPVDQYHQIVVYLEFDDGSTFEVKKILK